MKVKKLSMPMLSVLIAILILSFCIVSTGFATRSNNKVELNKVSPEWYSERTFSSRPICNDDEEYLLDANLNKGKTLSSMSTYPVSISKSALLNQASIVVRGTVLGFDYLTIRHINGTSTLPYTDYYIDVHETLRGNAELRFLAGDLCV